MRHQAALVAPHVALADDSLDIDRDRSEIPAHLEPAVTRVRLHRQMLDLYERIVREEALLH